MSLDGNWLFHPVAPELTNVKETERTQRYSQSDLLDASWETVTVPGYWDQPPGGWPWSNPNIPSGPHPDLDGEAWYRLHFDVPPEAFDSISSSSAEDAFTAYFEFGAVSAYTAVWLNGEYVGRHLGAYSPFALDVSKKILSASTNVIAVRVRDKTVYHNPQAENPNGTSEIPLGFDSDVGGIWQSVGLRIVPREHILDYSLETSLDALYIDVRVSQEAVGSSTLSVTVRDRGSGKTLYGPHNEPVQAFPGHPGGIRLTLQELQPRYWSPQDPHRYELDLELSNGRGESDRRSFDFGFKTFEARDGKFFLNGEPYFLFGAGSPPHFENPPVEVARKHLSHLKEAGVRMVRFAHEPPAPFWLDLCDELGLLAWVEGPLWAEDGPYDFANRAFVDQATKESIDLIRSLGNHPCLAIWSIGSGNCRAHRSPEGRQTASTVLDRMTRLLSQATHPTAHPPGSGSQEHSVGSFQRIVLPDSDNRDLIPSPVEDWTTGLGWYRGKTSDWIPFLDAVAARREGNESPWVSSRIETGYTTAGQGSMLSIPSERAAARMRIGATGNERPELLDYQSNRIKSLIEQARAKRDPTKNRIAGLFPFASSNWFFNPLTASAVEPKPILSAIAAAYRPVILNIELPKRHYYSEEVLHSTLTIVNDHPNLDQAITGALTLEVQVLGMGEQGGVSSKMDIPSVTPYSGVSLTRAVSLPEIAGLRPARVEVRLTNEEDEVAQNETRIWIGNPAYCKSGEQDLQKDVVVYDPHSTLTTLFQASGQEPPSLESLADLTNAAGLIVAPRAFDDYMARGWNQITNWVSGGGRVLILPQTPIENRWYFAGPYPGNHRLIEPKGWMGGVDRVNIRLPDHPVFDGIQSSYFRDWGKDGNLCDVLLERIQETPGDEVRVLVDVVPSSERLEWKGAVTEVRMGEGFVLLCQLAVAEKTPVDPLAALYWKNLLHWVGDARRPVLPVAPLPAGNFRSEIVGNSHGEVKADFSDPDVLEPIHPIPIPEGLFERVAYADAVTSTTYAGLLPRGASESGEGKVYFDLDDRFWTESPGTAEIETLVYALEPGEVRIDYDSTDEILGSGAAYKQTMPFPVLETGAWKVLLFQIPDAWFGGRQLESSDFRLVTVKGKIVFGPIAIRKVETESP